MEGGRGQVGGEIWIGVLVLVVYWSSETPKRRFGRGSSSVLLLLHMPSCLEIETTSMGAGTLLSCRFPGPAGLDEFEKPLKKRRRLKARASAILG